MWQGLLGIWWTKDMGHEDTKDGWNEATENNPYLPFLRNRHSV